MRHCGGDLFETEGRHVSKKDAEKSAGDIGKGIAVEKEEGGFAVETAQLVERFNKSDYFAPYRFPLSAARFSTF